MIPHPPRRPPAALPRRGVLAALGWLASGLPAAALPVSASGTGLTRRAHALAGTVLAAAAQAGGNALVSPLNLLEALAPLVPAARGPARAALNQTYAGSAAATEPLSDIAALFRMLSPPPGAAAPPALSHAAALWVDGQEQLQKQTAAVLRDTLGLTISSLSLNSPQALELINGWVTAKTYGNIAGILDRMPADASAVITAALYFAARWQQAFDPGLTRSDGFMRADGQTAPVAFMRTGEPATAGYGTTGPLHAIALPYADTAFEFIALAPRPGGDPGLVPGLVENGSALATLDDLTFAVHANLEIALPRLSLNQAEDLLPILQQGPLAAALAPGADLSGLLHGPFQVTAIESRTVLKIDEAGTVASAATAVVGSRSMSLDTTAFRADMPFLAAVRHRESRLIIVAALIRDPAAS